MTSIIAKLKSWIPSNIAALIGIAQAIVKFSKEVCTLFIDLIAPIIPGDNDDKIVKKIRDIFNAIDAILEKIKAYLLNI